MAVSIREATIKDFDNIYQFICELQGKVFDRKSMELLYQENISNKDNTYLIAEDDNNSIGYLSCHIQTLLHHAGKVAEIQEMFVIPKFRSAGVGKLLMAQAKNIAQRKGAIQLEVTTRVIREEAIRFYIRESFENTHRKLVYYF